MSEGKFKKGLQKKVEEYLKREGYFEFDYEYKNGMKIIEIVNAITYEARKEFPKRAEFPYETCVEVVEDEFYDWLEKWFGDVKP